MRFGIKVGAILLAILAVAPLLASAQTVNQTAGLALKGYDPVAYFTENKAVKGSSQFTAKYQGATYEFESAANREAFNANPAKYAPQYGGYCAYGVASGHKADITPQPFSIVDGKLYLNYNRTVRFLWKRDIPGYISKADKNWPEISKAADPH
jgi:YHS domain-containing protein